MPPLLGGIHETPTGLRLRHDYEVKRVHKVHTDGAISERQQVGSEVLDRYGFNPIPAGGAPVTNDLVNKLREELGI